MEKPLFKLKEELETVQWQLPIEQVPMNEDWVYYLAMPYHKDPEASLRRSLEWMIKLSEHGLVVYSPILETHFWYQAFQSYYDTKYGNGAQPFWYQRDLLFCKHLSRWHRLIFLFPKDFAQSEGCRKEWHWAHDHGCPCYALETILQGPPERVVLVDDDSIEEPAPALVYYLCDKCHIYLGPMKPREDYHCPICGKGPLVSETYEQIERRDGGSTGNWWAAWQCLQQQFEEQSRGRSVIEVNNLKPLLTEWFTNFKGSCGLIVAEDQRMHTRHCYVGICFGNDEDADTHLILEWGLKLSLEDAREIVRLLEEGAPIARSE